MSNRPLGRAGLIPLVALILAAGCWLNPGKAFAGTFLFVSDTATDTNIPTALIADGHTVTVVTNDYVAATQTNPTLVGSLAAYDAVFWSATGAGLGDPHAAGTIAALTTYVTGGGHVFVTGYDSIASPADPNLYGFLGGTGSVDRSGGPGPGAVVATANALTTGVVDIRGVTPTGGYADLDSMTGFGASVTVVATTTGVATEAQWLLRTLGTGLIGYVSNGELGPTSAHASWTTTTAGGAGAYNAALRNFAFHSARARVLFVSDVATDTNIPGVLTGDRHTVTTVLNDYVAATSANPTLEGPLGAYDVVVWSATGAGSGSAHRAETFANLTAFVNAGGLVFVTGYDSIASPPDPDLVAFLGGTGSVDRAGGPGPGAIVATANSLNTGVVDIRGVTPTGGYADLDSLTGFGASVTVVATTTGVPTEAQWLIRTLGTGLVAYVSDGAVGPASADASWTTTTAGGAGAYNAAVRNFVAAAALRQTIAVTAGGACVATALCGVGACADGVCCNTACGGSLATDCQACSTATGAAVNGVCGAVAAARTCRASTGVCDAAEVCNGSALTCPADAMAAAGTACRASTGVCDAAEACTGASATCPADAFAAAGTSCRASAGVCDVAESCTGASAACPANAFTAAGSTCRASAGVCDAAEACTGAAAACPADTFAAAGTSCRVSTGVCDAAEACTGAAAACPADSFAAAGTACRASAGACDAAEACTGAGAACPADGFAAAGTGCRASADVCDAAEACSGASALCPADGFAAAGTGCRAAADVCDVAEACTGAAAACPADAFASTGTTCRAAAGTCDVAEACSGAAAACPADGFTADGTACADGAVCNGDEVCATGTCAAGTTLACDDADVCTADSCAEPGGCAHDAIAGCCTLDTDCDDGDACTDDVCDVGNTCAHDMIPGCGVDAGVVDGGIDTDSGIVDTDAGADAGTDAGTGGDASVDAGSLPRVPADSGGCGCAVPGTSGTSTGGAGLLGLGLLAIVIARRRRR